MQKYNGQKSGLVNTKGLDADAQAFAIGLQRNLDAFKQRSYCSGGTQEKRHERVIRSSSSSPK